MIDSAESFRLFKAFFVGFSCLLFFERILEIKLHKKLEGRIKAKWTTYVMIAGHLLCFSGTLIELFFFEKGINFVITTFGFLLFGLSFFIRRWVMKEMGDLWSINNELRKNHRLVTTGPFKLCRHPNYFAIILEIVGFCLIANAYVTMVTSLCVYLPVIVLRIKLEEAFLSVKFKNLHQSYCEKVSVITPFLRINGLENIIGR